MIGTQDREVQHSKTTSRGKWRKQEGNSVEIHKCKKVSFVLVGFEQCSVLGGRRLPKARCQDRKGSDR
jgi:hypothetical protein